MIARGFVAVLVLVASLELGEFAVVQGKGLLGQWLMESAWARADANEAPESPWPGARTRPAARLYVPDLKLDRLVVEGVATPNLAWGPGLRTGPNGHILIAAHRDTHFRFLGDLEPGHRLELERPGEEVGNWKVAERRIVDSRTTKLDMDAAGPLLTLVTCYPLDSAEPGGPLRLVVTARPESGDDA